MKRTRPGVVQGAKGGPRMGRGRGHKSLGRSRKYAPVKKLSIRGLTLRSSNRPT